MSRKIEFSISAAIAIKTARTALGLSQTDLADLLCISKTTLARIETFESAIKIDLFYKVIEIFNSKGVSIEIEQHENIRITINPEAQQAVVDLLADEANRRVDRRAKIKL